MPRFTRTPGPLPYIWLPPSTWAAKPAASAVPAGTRITITDVGPATTGSDWVSDGAAYWKPVNGHVLLAQCAVPSCLAPDGTIATNGIVTLGTALQTTYSGGVWLRFPANAVVSGSAGMYYTVMTSTTQGQAYTNFNDASGTFIPSIPSSLVAAVGSNSAYTQTTGAEVTLINFSLLASMMGLYGMLRSDWTALVNNTAGTKFLKVKLGTAVLDSTSRANSLGDAPLFRTWNKGSASIQMSKYNTTPAADSRTTANTAADATFSFSSQLAVSTDYQMVEAFTIELLVP